jgi:hypothetical protein
MPAILEVRGLRLEETLNLTLESVVALARWSISRGRKRLSFGVEAEVFF